MLKCKCVGWKGRELLTNASENLFEKGGHCIVGGLVHFHQLNPFFSTKVFFQQIAFNASIGSYLNNGQQKSHFRGFLSFLSTKLIKLPPPSRTMTVAMTVAMAMTAICIESSGSSSS